MDRNKTKLKNMDDGSQTDPGTASPFQRGYPGGKNSSGAYQRLINWIPPHNVYIEPFLGSGAIMRTKKTAAWSIGVDKDYDVIKLWATREHVQKVLGSWEQVTILGKKDSMNLVYDDAITVINRIPSLWSMYGVKTFIFCDPPYIMETRSTPGRIYKYEYTEAQHVELLKLLASLKCMVMITGYRHPIYDDALSSWHREDYQTNTRGGLKDESCWMNYPLPAELHDYSFLGETFKEREKIKLQQDRWIKRLEKMPMLKRRAMLEKLNNFDFQKEHGKI